MRNCLGFNDPIPNIHQKEIGPLVVAEPTAMEPPLLPSEAVFAFAAWLTCRRDAVTLGALHEAGQAAELVAAFCMSQGFTDPRDNYHHMLKPYPADSLPGPAPAIDWPAVGECSDVVKADADGWIAHDGGECPVSGTAVGFVRMQDGYENLMPERLAGLGWSHRYGDGNIVAYRVVA